MCSKLFLPSLSLSSPHPMKHLLHLIKLYKYHPLDLITLYIYYQKTILIFYIIIDIIIVIQPANEWYKIAFNIKVMQNYLEKVGRVLVSTSQIKNKNT